MTSPAVATFSRKVVKPTVSYNLCVILKLFSLKSVPMMGQPDDPRGPGALLCPLNRE